MRSEYSFVSDSDTVVVQNEITDDSFRPVCNSSPDAAESKYQQARQNHWNEVARKQETWTSWGGYYHRRLNQVYQSLVAPGQSVIELGCGRGDLLAALKPSEGLGVDFSGEMIGAARRRHPQLRFIHADAHVLDATEKFDVIILSDLVNDLWDVETVLKNVSQLTTPRSRILINCYSRLWEPVLKLAQRLGLSRPNLYQNWLTVEDITRLLNLADCEVIKQIARSSPAVAVFHCLLTFVQQIFGQTLAVQILGLDQLHCRQTKATTRVARQTTLSLGDYSGAQ